MVESKHSLKAVAAAITTVLVAHGAHQPEVCFVEKYDCPEPEQVLPDMPEHGRPSGPTGPSSNTYMTSGPTGPTGSAAIFEGPDAASGNGNTIIVPGTGALNTVSAAPQIYEDIQPRIFPSVG
jgi:hypothetical protein